MVAIRTTLRVEAVTPTIGAEILDVDITREISDELVNPFFTSHILDVPDGESRAVREFLYEHCADSLFSVRFRWRANSVAFWDNRCTLHRAMKDYLPATRSGIRVQIEGDRPL